MTPVEFRKKIRPTVLEVASMMHDYAPPNWSPDEVQALVFDSTALGLAVASDLETQLAILLSYAVMLDHYAPNDWRSFPGHIGPKRRPTFREIIDLRDILDGHNFSHVEELCWDLGYDPKELAAIAVGGIK